MGKQPHPLAAVMLVAVWLPFGCRLVAVMLVALPLFLKALLRGAVKDADACSAVAVLHPLRSLEILPPTNKACSVSLRFSMKRTQRLGESSLSLHHMEGGCTLRLRELLQSLGPGLSDCREGGWVSKR